MILLEEEEAAEKQRVPLIWMTLPISSASRCSTLSSQCYRRLGNPRQTKGQVHRERVLSTKELNSARCPCLLIENADSASTMMHCSNKQPRQKAACHLRKSSAKSRESSNGCICWPLSATRMTLFGRRLNNNSHLYIDSRG